MRPRAADLARAAALLLGMAGCAGPAYPPAIRAGSACAACGMTVENMRFACEQRAQGSWRAYDSIECLLREAASTRDAFLADYDTQTLHAADSMWVVHGRIDSPMGGGFAAFLDRAAADEVAASTGGDVRTFAMRIASSAGSAP